MISMRVMFGYVQTLKAINLELRTDRAMPMPLSEWLSKLIKVDTPSSWMVKKSLER